MKDEE